LTIVALTAKGLVELCSIRTFFTAPTNSCS